MRERDRESQTNRQIKTKTNEERQRGCYTIQSIKVFFFFFVFFS